MIRIDVVRDKAGCRPECTLSITENGRVTHNGSNWHYDVAAHMAPEYDGPGWLTKAMDAIAEQHK